MEQQIAKKTYFSFVFSFLPYCLVFGVSCYFYWHVEIDEARRIAEVYDYVKGDETILFLLIAKLFLRLLEAVKVPK